MTSSPHVIDQYVHDPSGLEPLCPEPEFAEFLESLVADDAPRVFAVAQEYGERVDVRIAAWGLAFDGRADVVSVEGSRWISVEAPEDALRFFRRGTHISPRLVWVDPDAATPDDATTPDDDAT